MASLYETCEKLKFSSFKLSNPCQNKEEEMEDEYDIERLQPEKQTCSSTGKTAVKQSVVSGIGNPAPIGLFAFGMTTMMLMFKDMGWTDPGFVSMVFGYALFYGGLAQLIAGFFELCKGNTFAATAFSSYGAFWLGWYMMSFYKQPGEEFQTGFALYFIQWGVFTLGMWIIALMSKCGALKLVFGSLALTFFLLAGGVYNETVNKAAGYVGFLCGLSAFYTAYAEIILEELGTRLPGL